MKNWQQSRNYRQIKDKNGNIIANIITVDGIDVEVSEEVFLAYSQADRRERYIAEEVEPGMILSLDKLLEDGVPLESLGAGQIESAENMVIAQLAALERQKQKEALCAVCCTLKESDMQLMIGLFYEDLSTREYARRIGVSQRAVIKRRDRILREMRQQLQKVLLQGYSLT